MILLYGSGTVNVPAVVSSGVAIVLCASGIGFGLLSPERSVQGRAHGASRDGAARPVREPGRVRAGGRSGQPDQALAELYFDLYMLNPTASLIETFDGGSSGEACSSGTTSPTAWEYRCWCSSGASCSSAFARGSLRMSSNAPR